MNENVIIRAARPGDASALLEIYAWYVDNTVLSYEYDAPSADEFRGRIINIRICGLSGALTKSERVLTCKEI